MEEMIKETALGQPAPEEQAFSQEEAATTPPESDNAFLEVKFNKETKKLSLSEAATLAQKGMKLDKISAELDTLQAMAREQGIGFSEFVSRLKSNHSNEKISALREKYSEDSELCELLSTLDKNKETAEIDEIKAIIPDIGEIPQEVKTAAKTNGRGLLVEYLLYEHRLAAAAKSEQARQEAAQSQSLGPLSCGANNITDAEFIKGIWGN